MKTSRTEHLQGKLSAHEIQAFLVTSPYNIAYLTGITPSSVEEREFYIFITESNTYILAPQMFMMAVREKTNGVDYVLITPDKNLYQSIAEISKKENIKRIGFEKKNLLFREFELLQTLKGLELEPLEDFIEEKRTVKDADEIESIKQACRLTDDAYSHVLKKIRMNMTEKELAWEIEQYIRKNGGRLAFSTIVAFGKNAAVPHHIATDDKLESNNFVLLDFGAKVNGYCADMSRTVFFGTPSGKQVKMYNTVKDAQEMALKKLKEWQTEDFPVSHLQAIAESHIEKEGFPSFPHALGHGIGLEVHETPSVSPYSEDGSLEEHMVITIEPGIYLPELGGVRIEDDVLLISPGYEILTNSPKELLTIA